MLVTLKPMEFLKSRTPKRLIHARYGVVGLCQGGAWAVPAILVAAPAPAFAISPTAKVLITATTTCFTDNGPRGYIVPGLSVQVTTANGTPLANEPVTISITSSWNDWDTFYFLADPNTATSKIPQYDVGQRLRSLTLLTDSNGMVRLDDGKGRGYLRRGDDGERQGTNFLVSVPGVSTSTGYTYVSEASGNTWTQNTFELTNSSSKCGTDASKGRRPAAG